jgi:hypothetical protein
VATRKLRGSCCGYSRGGLFGWTCLDVGQPTVVVTAAVDSIVVVVHRNNNDDNY